MLTVPVPLGRMYRPLISVSRASASSGMSFSDVRSRSRSLRPQLLGALKIWCRCGLRMSASSSSTFWLISASAMPRLLTVELLPSPRPALVTRMTRGRCPFCSATRMEASALRNDSASMRGPVLPRDQLHVLAVPVEAGA